MISPARTFKSSNGFGAMSSNFKTPAGRMLESEFGTNSLGVASGSFMKNINQLNEETIVNIFKDQLELERKLERAKTDLSLRTDFNLIDAFRMFDVEGNGAITIDDIRECL